MKTSVIVPVFNESHRIPALVRQLKANAKKAKDLEIIFVDNGSTDGSAERLRAAALPGSQVLEEKRRGFAEPLNKALSEASGELLLFLDSGSLPAADWALTMEKALSTADLVVGKTLSAAIRKASPYGALALKIFEGHSERTARAFGHALPWGSTCNLGIRRSLMEKVGPFSSEAESAFDIDWCWRAILQSARIGYCEKAVVTRERPNDRRELLEQFERFGIGEAWLHRTYSFLLAPEDQETDPLVESVNAFLRLRHQSSAAKIKTYADALEEVAVAFSGGVRLGYERPHRECSLERRAPEAAISWPNGPKSVSVFVYGKGLALMEGKELQLWEALQMGDDDEMLASLFKRLYRTSESVARREVKHFRENLRPAAEKGAP